MPLQKGACPTFDGEGAKEQMSPSSSFTRPADVASTTNALVDAKLGADALTGLLSAPQLAVNGFGSARGRAACK